MLVNPLISQKLQFLNMKVIKQKKQGKARKIILRLAVLAFVAYVVVALVDQQMQISAKKQELEKLNEQIRIQEIENEDKRSIVESDDADNEEYIARVAREDLDFARPGERVFINIAGN